MQWLQRILGGALGFLRSLLPGRAPLCDTCKNDYGNVCKRPERPNAMTCPDYERKR